MAKKKRGRKYGITSKAKKKTAVARAVIKNGGGKITINKMNISGLQPKYVYEFVHEPLDIVGSLGKEVDIAISAKGGGYMGQAVAARAAIAKALLEYSGDEKLKQKLIKYDRLLLVDDARRVEPKKPLGPKARKKKQKSKR